MVKKDDNRSLEKIRYLFINLNDAVNNYFGTYNRDRLRSKILFSVFYPLLLKSFNLLQKLSTEYLFPYPKI